MKLNHAFALILILSVAINLSAQNQMAADTVISAEEVKLYDLIMAYRESKNLSPIPLSKSLTYVARTHCHDLAIYKPDNGNGCNAHSWSEKGSWTGCCYTPDHKEANCMWNKPRELTRYEGNGYEIACGDSDPTYSRFVMSADYALSAWQGSYHHNNVILNNDIWKDTKWNAIGVGIYQGFATVWFGEEIDGAGEPSRQVD
jgi:uncharacterized protein YkwD